MQLCPARVSLLRPIQFLILSPAFGLILLAQPAAAQIVTNGSLEEITPGAYVNGPNDFMEATPPETWSTVSGTVDWFFGPGVDLWDTPWGTHFAHGASSQPVSAPVGGSLATAIATSGPDREGLSQTLSGLTPGEMYELHFQHANGYFFPPPGPPSVIGGWEVFLDDTSILQATSTNDASSGSFPFTTDWSISSTTFTALTANPVLTFLSFAQSPPTGQAASFQWLDNVQVIRTVPEPGGFSIALLAGLVAGCRRQRECLNSGSELESRPC